MSYSKVSGRYIYGNGDFYHFEGYITDLWGGGNYYTGQSIYWNSSSLDYFSYWDSYNNTGHYGYYILDEVINFSGSIYSSSEWRNDGLKVLSYYDSNSNLILIPNESKTYGLGNENSSINGYAYGTMYFSNSTTIDLGKLDFKGSFWGDNFGFLYKNQIKSINGNVSSNGYKFHKFDCYKKNYLHFTLDNFSSDLDFELFKYNNKLQQWETILNAETNSNNSEYFFKILDPNSYIIAVTNYSNNFNQSYRLEIDSKSFHENTILPNDSRFEEQWSLLNYGQGDGFDNTDIFAPEAWKIRSTSPNVVVAIIDSGIDYNHEDLKNNIWKNNYEIPNNGIDDDLNGYVDDYLGWDFYYNDNNPHPYSNLNIHGTHVAGIIGAEGNNLKGIAGVSWDVQLMNLKVFSDYKSIKSAYASHIWDAIKYAADNGADIINLSLGIDIGRTIVNGGYYYSGTFNDFKNIAPDFYNGWYSALKYASDKGCLIIAAAGNEYSNNDNFTCIPADFAYEIPGMISVAAASNKGRISSYSNYGNIISLAAPGGDFNSGLSSQILSTTPNNSYEAISGTSMAAPIVSGAAALLIGENSSLSHTEIKQILMNSSNKYKWLSGKVDSGFLDLYEAISLSQNFVSSKAPTNINLSSTNFNENINANSSIATLSSSDTDNNDTFTFTLISGDGDTDNSYFTINGSSLLINTSPNYETKYSYNIRLKTTNNSGKSYSKALTLSVNDINEAPTNWNFSSYNFDENIAANSTVATISAVDEDTSDSHTFELIDGYSVSSGNSNFYIDGNQLKIRTSPDYETQSSYTVVVKVTDAAGLTSPDLYTTLRVNNLVEKEKQSPVVATENNGLNKGTKYTLNEIKDYDGNSHGYLGNTPLDVISSYKYQGTLDVNHDGTKEAIYTNQISGRWVTASIDPITGAFDYSKHGQGGTTRIVGIYEDPLVKAGIVEKDSDLDGSRTFINDLKIDNLQLKVVGDFDFDGFQEIYWSKVDNTAYLRAVMHADGNIQYANYQNLDQMTDYLTTHGFADTVALIA